MWIFVHPFPQFLTLTPHFLGPNPCLFVFVADDIAIGVLLDVEGVEDVEDDVVEAIDAFVPLDLLRDEDEDEDLAMAKSFNV